jgi:drug/metabolite transporter (DMT)-like permease
MQPVHVAAALFSAFLHAGWNAAIKASPRPTEAMTAQMLFGALAVLPLLAWSGLPNPAAWPWIAASTATNVVTVTAMLRAYGHGGFGVVYPVMRAVSVLLVVPLATTLAGDRLGLGALGGIQLIVSALALLAWAARRNACFSPRALAWTLAAGLCTAVYVLCDARGVRTAGSPWTYGFTVSITNALAMSWRHRRLASPWRMLAGNLAIGAPAAVASMLSYVLILWVWTRAPVAPAAALRDTSAVFAILIAAAVFRERFSPASLLAVLLSAAAVPLLRLG